jgi:hypothetical protein
MPPTCTLVDQLLVYHFASQAVPFAFKSKLQPTVAASSTENECMAAMVVAKLAKYLRSILIEHGFSP